MRAILIELANNRPLRYPTLGDYVETGDSLVISVNDTGDWRYNFLVGLHEMIEAAICKNDGIETSRVDEFDINYFGDGEPGDNPAAPYHKQHMIASNIEFQMCRAFGLDWDKYEAELSRTFKKIYPETNNA